MEPKQVFQEALELPRSARAALAAELIASLDEEVEQVPMLFGNKKS